MMPLSADAIGARQGRRGVEDMAAETEFACPSLPAEIEAGAQGWRRWALQFIWFPLAYAIFGVVGGITSIGCLVLSCSDYRRDSDALWARN